MLVFDYTLLVVLSGRVILGVCSGLLSSFAVLRQQSLFGDAIAHATLPGLCLVFMVTLYKSSFLFFLGAIAAGLLAAFLIRSISAHSLIKPDASMGLVLSVFFGFGLVLLTFIQKLPHSSQSGLSSFLFGSAQLIFRQV